jgi:cytoskeletal protein CcmA (bactofilin family)
MLQPTDNHSPKSPYPSNSNSYTPIKAATVPLEQATIGRSLVIKGEVSGAESLYVDGRIEGTISIPESRVTIGRNGSVAANINAREVVIMGKVNGNIQCSDRLDIRSEGVLSGDVVTQRISVEDGAVLKGSVQVRAVEHKNEKAQNQGKPASVEPAKSATTDHPKAAAAVAGA